VSCYADYITIDNSTPSRSGLYASDLPGVDILLLDSLAKPQQDSYKVLYNSIYKRAWDNLVSDVEKALQSKFHVDKKIISRETSEFLTTTHTAGEVRIRIDLPKYARLHIISIGIKSVSEHFSPEAEFFFTDENEETLYSKEAELVEGYNTINIDQDFEVCDLTVSYEGIESYQTKNKYYPGFRYYSEIFCEFDCIDNFYPGKVDQMYGGGLNIKFNVICSVEKYICDNINLFKQALYYRLGLELVVERRFGNRINEFTTMTTEDAEKLQEFYNTQFQQELLNATKAVDIKEDPICFNCKSIVSSRPILP
jgi:hypothetical protein